MPLSITYITMYYYVLSVPEIIIDQKTEFVLVKFVRNEQILYTANFILATKWARKMRHCNVQWKCTRLPFSSKDWPEVIHPDINQQCLRCNRRSGIHHRQASMTCRTQCLIPSPWSQYEAVAVMSVLQLPPRPFQFFWPKAFPLMSWAVQLTTNTTTFWLLFAWFDSDQFSQVSRPE